MSLIRLIVIALLVWIVYRMIRISLEKRKIQPKSKPKIADMVACEYCGLHIPAEEAIQSNDRSYCCREHQKLDIK